MGFFYNLKQKKFYFAEAKIGGIVFLANLVTVLVFFLLASLIALIGISTGLLGLINASPTTFDMSIVTGLGIFTILVLLVLLYISFVIRGFVLKKALRIFKVGI